MTFERAIRIIALAGACAAALSLAALPSYSQTAPAAPAHTGKPTSHKRAGTPLYKNAKASIPARVNDLIARMTLEEKIAQISTIWQNKDLILDEQGDFDAAKASRSLPHGIGQIARPSDLQGTKLKGRGRNTKESVALINAMQKWAIEQTRLGIPILFHEEGLHGAVVVDGTMFPQAVALASTWDTDLVRRVNEVTGRELYARGIQQVLSPVVDIARDPRWGRIEETFGEDPFLVGEMGVAAVRGLQGDKLPLEAGHVFATLKHMTGHGQPESGTNVGPALISERTLREDFFPPFEQAVKRTNIRAVMASYNEIDGVPSHANKWLLGTVLRGEWGYQGAVVSDYFAIEQMADIHRIEPDHAAAAARAIKAGVDVDLPNGVAFATLLDSVRAGRVSQKEIDSALRRFLTMKFEAGLFENPYRDADTADRLTGNAEADALALEAARKAVVLLKNDGMLPLNAGGKLAVIGPNANAIRLGGYSSVPRRTVNILEGIQAKAGATTKILYAEGVGITESSDWGADEVRLVDPGLNQKKIKEAVKIAKKADRIILVLGDTEQTSREAWADNHLGDRDSLDLVGQQNDLANAIFALKKPVTVVLINGRPLSVVNIAARANALIEGWYLGQATGTAMADILFGDSNPGGKLPVTIARSVGQLPVYYNMKPSARRGYLFNDISPLYPFGYGLSYTRFDIGEPRLSSAAIKANGSVDVSVAVQNVGQRAGDEVVQLYVRDKVSSVTRPLKELKGFERVSLRPGEAKTVTFKITPEALRLWSADMKRVVEPGEFDIMAGGNSVDLKKATLTVTK